MWSQKRKLIALSFVGLRKNRTAPYAALVFLLIITFVILVQLLQFAAKTEKDKKRQRN